MPVPTEGTLGHRLKRARRECKATLKKVAATAGCSESVLSKLENNKAQVSLNLLRRVCKAVNLTMGELFAPGDGATNVVVPAGQREIVRLNTSRARQKSHLECLVPRDRFSTLQGNIHVMSPGCGSEGMVTHEGEEIGYVISGKIELTVGERVYQVKEGDSFYFRSEVPHGYRNIGKTEARIIFINSPPTF
jgi:mannose-6-phosphate isomerase-like protein (cupin superfamily)/DNA-binding Xre family transcriptional regulator